MLCCGHMLLPILTVKKLLEQFTKKNFEEKVKKTFITKKLIKRKDNWLYVK